MGLAVLREPAVFCGFAVDVACEAGCDLDLRAVQAAAVLRTLELRADLEAGVQRAVVQLDLHGQLEVAERLR